MFKCRAENCPDLNYIGIGVLGRPVTLFSFSASKRPSFFNSSMRSKRFSTLRFCAPPVDFPKLLCLDITVVPYLIFGMNAHCAASPESAFICSLKPEASWSFFAPVFGDGGLHFLGERLRLSFCLLMRTMVINSYSCDHFIQ